MQSVVSKQMCNIIESYVETIRIQVDLSLFSPVLKNVRRTLSSLVLQTSSQRCNPLPPPPTHTHTKKKKKKRRKRKKGKKRLRGFVKQKTKITIIFYAIAS